MENTKNMADVEISKITPSKTNPRKAKDTQKMNELEDSIREKGVLQPIVVRPMGAGYEIVCGERRFTSAKKVGLLTIPAVIRNLDDKAVLEIQLIENAQRADVHPLEEAEGYEQLMKKYGYAGAEEIAAKVGKGKSYVYGRLKLCDLVPECRKMFYDGKLTPSTAILIARMPKDLQKKAAEDITEDHYNGPMSLIDARRHLQQSYMLDFKGVVFAKDNTICPERGKCSTCPKRTSNQESLFEDIKDGDKCTDPACFNAKRQWVINQATVKAQRTGFEVVETEKVFPYGNHVGGGYVELKDKCYADEKNRPYKDILKNHKTFRMVLAVDASGNIREVAKEKDVKKAMAEVGFKSQHESSGYDPTADRKAKELQDAINNRLTDELMRMVKIDLKQSFWPILAAHTHLYDDAQCFIAKRIIPGTKRNDAHDVIAAHLKKLDIDQSRAYVIETYLAGVSVIPDLCQLYKIDAKAIEKEVKAKLAAPKAKAKK